MVDIEIIKNVIIDQEEELKNSMNGKLIQRDLKLGKLDKGIAHIITGLRRCGKSVLSFLSIKNLKGVYINFEDERLNLDVNEMNKILEAIHNLKGDVDVIVFDEIQNIDGWERFINRILPSRRIIITGSNARLLSKELATHLTGRHIDYTLFPFSFREFLAYKKIKPNIYSTKNRVKVKKMLEEYLQKGGIPLYYSFGNPFILNLFRDIVERDIIQRYEIKQKKVLKSLANYYISNISSLISFNKLSKLFNIGDDTLKDYSYYLSNAYLLFFIKKFDYKLKEQERSPKKVYCVDNAFFNVLGDNFSKNKGKLMENVVAIELLRRKSYYHNKWGIYYWKDYQQKEVDFLVKEENKVKKLIQVTYASSREEINERELKGLIKGSKELKCDNLLVITWGYEAQENYKGKTIKFIPLWKWLLIY